MTTSLVISQPVLQQYVLLHLIFCNLTSNSLSGNGCNNRLLTRRCAEESYHERFWARIERESCFFAIYRPRMTLKHLKSQRSE
jgi:hypothetical protein